MSWINRRGFLATTVAGGLGAGLLRWIPRAASRRSISGQILGASAAVAHRLRAQGFPEPSRVEEVDVVVAGGGIAGLGAARHLVKRGCKRLILLDLEREPGGNAASGSNEISSYPWGAHYVPLPNRESVEVLTLLEELGVLTGWKGDVPVYDEMVLCGDPAERLFLHGRWQEGLIPQVGISEEDRSQYERFFTQMDRWRDTVGSDGRPAFAIPLDLSSRDPDFLRFDTFSMGAWLAAQAFTSKPLRWYVDYACRDDFGAGIEHISAWAGIHYFAARRGIAANASRDTVLTWPEGNGWLAKRMATELQGGVRARSLVWRIEDVENGVEVDYFDLASGQSVRLLARAAVCAMPYFVAQRVVRGITPVAGLEYSPWMVANVTLDTLPTGKGASLAWDNVMHDSASLGYVVATHQHFDPVPRRTVLTHYWPLDHLVPKEAREQALARSHAEWCELIVSDLERAHPGLRRHIKQVDVWLWGHGMIRPVPNLMWGGVRAQMSHAVGKVFLAHSDLSGMSIFEEAYTRGVQAAGALWQAIA